jgi:Fur family ferric uptake transcriptional regulator
MIDAQGTRIAALSNRVPTTVLLLEIIGSAVALGLLAVYLAILGRGVLPVLVAAALVVAILLVTFDLDRPTRGFIRDPTAPLTQLLVTMNAPPAVGAAGARGRRPDSGLSPGSKYGDVVSDVTSTASRQLLREHGLNVTSQRLAVLESLGHAPHSTADEIYTDAQASLGAISRQAVYDALATFTDKGILRRIQTAGSPARYETRSGDDHHHLFCRSCQRLVDVDCAVGDAGCLPATEHPGYEIDGAEVVYSGRCAACVARAPASRSLGDAVPEPDRPK